MKNTIKKLLILSMLAIFLAVQTGCEGNETDHTDTLLGGVLAGALVISQASSIIKRSQDFSEAEANVVRVSDNNGSGSSDGAGSDGSGDSGDSSGDSGDASDSSGSDSDTGPATPENPSPPDNNKEMGTELKLSWQITDYVFGQYTFDIYIGNAPDDLTIASKAQYSAEYTAYRLKEASRYYWKIKARDNLKRTATGPVWSFDTIGYVVPEENVAPTKPYDPVPQNDADYQPLTMTLTWQGGDENETDLVKYDLYLSATAPPESRIAEKITETSYSVSKLNKNQTYYWKIVSQDTSGLVTEGNVWKFKTGNDSKAKLPSNTTPSDKTVFKDELPTQLTWTGGSTDGSEVKYNVYLGETENNLNLNQGITETSFALTGMTYEKTYYWKIESVDDANISVIGPTWSFSTLKSVIQEPIPGSSNQEVTIHFIDVGQGDSILIEYLDYDILIDGGNSNDKALNYLQNQTINDIDLLIATHMDTDHIGGLDYIMGEYTVKNIIDSGTTSDGKLHYPNYITARDNERIEGAKYEEDSDRTINDFGDLKFEIIDTGDDYSDENNNSVVVLMTYSSTKVLFTGDMEFEAEEDNINRWSDVDVLKVGHHGSKDSTSDEFLKAITPEYAVISCSATNGYGHPTPEVLGRLSARNVNTILRTDQNGTIKFVTNGSSISITTER